MDRPTRSAGGGRHRRAPSAASPFRYTALVFPHGEIREIVESIGRRQVRTLNPLGREGRRLLARGEVALWCEGLPRPERRPVDEFLELLRHAVDEERERSAGDEARQEHCRRRRQALDDWAARFGGGSSRDH